MTMRRFGATSWQIRELDMCDADECDDLVLRVVDFVNLACVVVRSVTS